MEIVKFESVVLVLVTIWGVFGNHWAIELHPDANPYEIAARHGHEFVGQIGNLKGVYLFHQKPDTLHGVTHPHHEESKEIIWFEKQIPRQQNKRGYRQMAGGDLEFVPIVPDPLYNAQWHLHSTDSYVVRSKYHLNVEPAWKLNITGEGIVIAVVDDGLQHDHPDLVHNYRPDLSYDFNGKDPDPYPDVHYDDHGTSVAGAAAARDNDVCGVGTAFRAQLAGLRLVAGPSTDADEAAALSYMRDQIDIYSCSWGPRDDGKRKVGPGVLASRALEDSIRNGRQGKGNIFVWAGGNGRLNSDNCNYDGWANSRYTISITAVDWKGDEAYYAEPCAMHLACAPSSGAGRGITSTDLQGHRGSSANDCTSSFGMTSAAAPMVSGIVALILQANPDLTWRDMQAVLIHSVAKVSENDPEWQINGAGYRYSHKFGFGLVDAYATINTAKAWKRLPLEADNITVTKEEVKPIEQNSAFESVIVINSTAGRNFTIEHVYVYFRASIPARGDLEIVLQAPTGMKSVLAQKHNDKNSNYDWRFGSIAHWGEEPTGEWRLIVRNLNQNSSGVFISWTLQLFGHKSV